VSDRLAQARLYFVTDAATPDVLLRAALDGGVDMVQLRDRSVARTALLSAAERFRSACDDAGALFWINDDPELAVEAGADGVHVGQDDLPVEEARRDGLLVGLSTHSPAQFEAGMSSGADQLSVGPVWETPTKPGRPATGLEYVRHAAAVGGATPWFAIGGIDESNVHEVVDAGASRIVVVRAIRGAADPRAAAANLRAALDRRPVGAAQ
jgi:thiamine-phosphate pyrophosphorylase